MWRSIDAGPRTLATIGGSTPVGMSITTATPAGRGPRGGNTNSRCSVVPVTLVLCAGPPSGLQMRDRRGEAFLRMRSTCHVAAEDIITVFLRERVKLKKGTSTGIRKDPAR
jgi:hypothetical protein